MIRLSCIVRAIYYRKFHDKLSEVIYDFERQGLEVDIKYVPVAINDKYRRMRVYYTALVLGREKK